MLMDMRLDKFDVYQGTLAPRATQTLKNVFSGIRSEIHFV